MRQLPSKLCKLLAGFTPSIFRCQSFHDGQLWSTGAVGPFTSGQRISGRYQDILRPSFGKTWNSAWSLVPPKPSCLTRFSQLFLDISGLLARPNSQGTSLSGMKQVLQSHQCPPWWPQLWKTRCKHSAVTVTDWFYRILKININSLYYTFKER